jgi:hypothetical protein
MDHNDLNFQSDLIQPLKVFFSETGIGPETFKDSKTLEFPEDYYFPPLQILDFERDFLKNDNEIMRDILATRERLKRKVLLEANDKKDYDRRRKIELD